LRECPIGQRPRGFFRESLAAIRREHGVADLGAADQFRRAVKAAVPDDLVFPRNHEARHPVTPLGRLLHAVKLNREETCKVAGGRKLLGQHGADRGFGGGAISFDQLADRRWLEWNELEARRAEGLHFVGGTLNR